MNKKKLAELKELVDHLNEINESVVTVYTLESYAFQHGRYHACISTDATMFSGDLSAITDWAKRNKVICWGHARHSYFILDLL